MIKIYLDYINAQKENSFICEVFESLEIALVFIGNFSTYNKVLNITITAI